MPFATVDGREIYFEDSGGDGPAVIFSHGFLMDHEMFAPQVDALGGDFRCLTWDERGFGNTAVDAPFTYYDSAKDCLGILDHLGIERAVLAGMSQGGFLSLRAALTAPDRVAGLVLIDTQSGPEDPAALPAYQAMNAEWLANGPANVQDVVAGLILGEECDYAPWFEKWAKLPRESFAFTFQTLVERDDVTDRLGEITCPTIIFHGVDDQAIPMAKAELLQQRLGNCVGLVRVAGAGHAANLTHADQVNGPLREFLTSVAS